MPRLNFMVYSSFSNSAVRWNEPRLQKKRLKIACAYHSSFAACCAVGHTKCPIFDTKYTDRKNRVNYA